MRRNWLNLKIDWGYLTVPILLVALLVILSAPFAFLVVAANWLQPGAGGSAAAVVSAPPSEEAAGQTPAAQDTPVEEAGTATPQDAAEVTPPPQEPTAAAEGTPEEGASDTPESAEPAAPAYDPAVVAQGEQLFASVCAACHGPDARGLPNLGLDLVDSEFVRGLDDQALLAFVKTGRPVWDASNTTGVDMPPKGGNPAITDDELLSVIAYIRALAAAAP